MSPVVEGLRSVKLGKKDGHFFTVRLENPSPFQPVLFDQQVRAIGFDGLWGYICKFIVNGGVLYVLPPIFTHREFALGLGLDELQSGGEIVVSGDSSRRVVRDYSLTFTGPPMLLEREVSEAYKMGPLREKLGKFFDFS